MRASEVIADIYPGGDKLRSARVSLLSLFFNHFFARPGYAAICSTGTQGPALCQLKVTAGPCFEQKTVVRRRVVVLVAEAGPHRQRQTDAPEGERVTCIQRYRNGKVGTQPLLLVIERITAGVLRARINPERQAAIHKILVSKRHPKRGVNFLIPVGCNAPRSPRAVLHQSTWKRGTAPINETRAIPRPAAVTSHDAAGATSCAYAAPAATPTPQAQTCRKRIPCAAHCFSCFIRFFAPHLSKSCGQPTQPSKILPPPRPTFVEFFFCRRVAPRAPPLHTQCAPVTF
ncbi:hypothetical protein TPACW86_0135 [Treponema pallidum subsp. pallidum]|nr:hypothetical protein TPACW86_0135 [Treponema pallidum subsp. pallidum]